MPSQLLKKSERVSLAEQGMEAFHHEHEEHGRERVPLSKTTTMANPLPGDAIEKDSSTSSGKNGEIQLVHMRGHPTATRSSRRKLTQQSQRP
jgi:hypothetical protein